MYSAILRNRQFHYERQGRLHEVLIGGGDQSHKRSAVSDVRVTSCFADFDQQNGFTGIAATGAVLKLRSIDLYEMTYN